MDFPRWLLPLLFGLVFPYAVWGQMGTAPPVDAPPPTAEEIQKQIDALGSDEPAEALKKTYSQALKSIANADQWRKKEEDSRSLERAAPVELQRVQTELGTLTDPLPLNIPENADQVAIGQLLKSAQEELDKAEQDLVDPSEALTQRDLRLSNLRMEISKLDEKLRGLKDQLAAKPPAEEPAAQTQARKWALRAAIAEAEANLAAWRAEIDAANAREPLIPAGHDLATKRMERLRERVERLRTAYERQGAKASERLEQLRRKASALEGAVDSLQPLTAEVDAIEQLLSQQEDLDVAAASRLLEKTKREKREFSQRVDSLKNYVEIAGVQDSGKELRAAQARLPDLAELQRDIQRQEEEFRALRLELLKLRERPTDEISAEVTRLTDQLTGSNEDEEFRRQVAEIAHQAVSLKQETLNNTIQLAQTYRDQLEAVVTEERAYYTEAVKHRSYIREKVLWVQSAEWGPQDLPQIAATLAWLGSAENWSQVGAYLVEDARKSWVIWILTLIGLLALLNVQRLFRRELPELVEEAEAADSLLPTFQAVGITLLLAAFWPLLMASLGWRLAFAPTDSFAYAVGGGFLAAASVLAPLELLRQIVRPQGLAIAHFLWPRELAAHVRGLLRLFVFLVSTGVLVVMTIEHRHSLDGSDPLARVLFILMCALVTCLSIVWLRSEPEAGHGADEDAENWLVPLRYTVYLFAVVLPAVLGALALFGFFYTALELASNGLFSLQLAVVLLLIEAVGQRWIFLNRLALEQPVETLDEPAEAPDDLDAAAARQDTDIEKADSQSRLLVRSLLAVAAVVGFWLIWFNTIPALGIFREVELWSTTETVSEVVADAEGREMLQTMQRVVPVTLAELGQALLIFGVTLLIARNLPGLLEVSLLGWIGWESGARYAATALAQYATGIVGVVVSLGILGISWESVQWIAAGMTVGLAFGLQEIFANFVSGLIILFERPIRVGDIVTVGDTSGSVTRIQIRATTIMDWDKKELLVPNKEIVTGRVLNWTLTNNQLRLIFKVGVAYGTDVQRVYDLLLDIARQHPKVLDDPAPIVLFMGFGESSVDFELRPYVELADGLETINGINAEIVRRFAEEGLEIPFPQRDLHVRTVPPGLFPRFESSASASKPAFDDGGLG